VKDIVSVITRHLDIRHGALLDHAGNHDSNVFVLAPQIDELLHCSMVLASLKQQSRKSTTPKTLSNHAHEEARERKYEQGIEKVFTLPYLNFLLYFLFV